MYTPVQTERLFERIVEQIEARVRAGELKVGDQLPSERELAEQFQVSRTAVREAIKTLREKGLVQILPGRGTFIINGASRAMRQSLGLLTRPGAEGASHLVEVREILEPEIAALAALRAGPEHLSSLRQAVQTMEAALEASHTLAAGEHPAQRDGNVRTQAALAADLFVEADLDFHLALAEATQNAVIPALIDSIVELLREERKRTALSTAGMGHGQQHHRLILQAVERRDPEAARSAMHAHLRQVREDRPAPAGSTG